MPQMAPMSWLTLFMFFSSMLMIMTMMNYYIYKPLMEEEKSMSINNKTMNWKW